MSNINKRMSINSSRIERWLGTEKLEELVANMRHGGGPGCQWYGPPINLRDVPGSVWITGDGDFVGDFNRGWFDSAKDSLERYAKRVWKEMGRNPEPVFGAGFASISDALSRASGGFGQILPVTKTGVSGTTAAAASCWTLAGNPGAGAIGSAAPGGRATDKSTTGAIIIFNPASGTNHLTGADFHAATSSKSLMLYDRIFDVAKTMNSTTAESVTGVPTRYQSSTTTAMDYAGGSFAFPEVITVLPATAHNWDTMIYRNQAGTDTITAPSLAGIASAAAGRLDLPLNTWFMPLNTGDSGVMDMNSMKMSAAVATGTIDWVVAHPIGIMTFPVSNTLFQYDWLTNRQQAPRVFADACLALLELPSGNGTATTYTGQIYLCSAA